MWDRSGDARAPPETAERIRRRARRVAIHDRAGSDAARRRPGGVRGARSAGPVTDHAGRRDPLDGHVPLGDGSRASVGEPGQRAPARRAAGRPVRGAGNTERLANVLRDLGYELEEDKLFAGADETQSRLEGAGFDRIECWL